MGYANWAEHALHVGVYIAFFAGVAAAAVIGVRRLRNGPLAGALICLAVGILVGTKIECSTTRYRCGDMLYQSYLPAVTVVSVVLAFALWIAAAAVLRVAPGRLALSVRPLAGLWLVILWKVLPRPFIHPVGWGGSCPTIPLLCHDVPLLGHGELLWMSLPFLGWAAWSGWHAYRRDAWAAGPR